MFMMQVLNNGDTVGDFSLVQSLAMIIKCLCLVLLLIEMMLFVWEVITIRNMRELKFKGFEVTTEEERRKKNSQKVFRIAIVMFVLFIVGVIVAMFLLDGRVCDSVDQVAESGVCTSCKDDNCLDCVGAGSDRCDNCKPGFSLNPNGKCANCNQINEIEKCVKCKIGADQNQSSCTECIPGYRLELGKCIPCSQSKFCLECSQDKCLKCIEGYHLVGQECVACVGKLPHCK